MSTLEITAALPEAQRDHVGAAVLTDVITNSGAIVIRKLVSAADARTLDDAFQKALPACQADTQGHWFTPTMTAPRKTSSFSPAT